MIDRPSSTNSLDCSVEFYLLGRISVDDVFALQRRLVYESGERMDGRIDVLMCEHPTQITVGRSGSRVDVRLSGAELDRRQLSIEWVARGGGAVLHAPGQLAIYPIVPLAVHGWTVGEYLRRLRSALLASLGSLGIKCQASDRSSTIWGRSGCLAVCGVSVRNWIAHQGAFLNVCPAMQNFGYVDVTRESGPFGGRKRTMGSLVAESRRPARMSGVRVALVEGFVAAFEQRRYHLHTGHPLLTQTRRPTTA